MSAVNVCNDAGDEGRATMSAVKWRTFEDLERERGELASEIHDISDLRERAEHARISKDEARALRRLDELDFLIG